MSGPLWIFGYGSLIWRPAFPHAERRTGYLKGWARRFWQGSPDHRGAPEAPGRVATLVREAGAVCWGVVYRVEESAREAVLRTLDQRESGGFERRRLTVSSPASREAALSALVYVAGPGNRNFLGPSPLEAIAEQVQRARGRSGSNAEYVLCLAAALREIGAEDPHVEELAGLVQHSIQMG